MDMMRGGLLADVARDLAGFGLRNSGWMGWNLMLACVPAGLALLLFRSRAERSPVWWAGLVLFVLFLPNAPYVVTDLVHVRWAVLAAGSDRAVATVVVPGFAAFIFAGYLAYHLSLSQLDGYLRRTGVVAGRRSAVMVGIHGMCAVGVVLGRLARLNSWDAFTRPGSTVEQAVATLTWSRAPFALAATFLAIWLGHLLTAAVVESVLAPGARWVQGWLARLEAPRTAL